MTNQRTLTVSPSASPLGRFLIDPFTWWHWLEHIVITVAVTDAPFAAPGLVALLLSGRWLRARVTRRRHATWTRGARCVTVLAPPRVDLAGGDALWAHLSGLARPWWRRLWAGQPHLAWEYAWTGTGLAVRLWLPGQLPVALVTRAVEAAWPGAHTAVAPAEPALVPGHTAVAGSLRLAGPDVLPLRTTFDADPLRGLLQAATGLHGEQRALVQVLARPAVGARLRRARATSRRLKAGSSTGRWFGVLAWLLHRPQPVSTGKADPEHASQVRHSVSKLAGPQWEVAVRYAATDNLTARADAAAMATGQAALRGRAHALATAFSGYAWQNWLVRTRLRRPAQLIAPRAFDARGMLLSVAELAALAHLPADPDAPGLARAGARSVIPAPTVPTPAPGNGVKPLGVTDAGHPRPVGLHVLEARHHLHIEGATGSGKSTLLANLALDDARSRRGLVVIDPKGDLVDDLLHRLPANAADRIVVLDPADPRHPPCINPLEGDNPDVVVDNIAGIFRRIFPSFWGPRTDDIMRATCLTLMRYTRSAGAGNGIVTLTAVPRLLSESALRARVVPVVARRDPVLRGFWAWYEEMSDASRAAVIGPVMNKLRAFLLRSFVRQAIAAGPSTFDMADVLDGGICLVRLPKGVLGEETTRLLGSFVVAKVWQAASARSATHEAGRIDASLIIDEAHNFLTLPYPLEDMLAEARGYRLSLVLAHQNLAQLPRDLQEGISANARNKVLFQTSPEDARVLERHVQPHLIAHDLAHLGRYQAAARLQVDGAATHGFTLTTQPLPPPVKGRSRELRDASHDRFGGRPGDTSQGL